MRAGLWLCGALVVLVFVPHSMVMAQNAGGSAGGQQGSGAGGATAATPGPTSVGGVAAPSGAQARVTEYKLAPEREKKARAISKVRLRLAMVSRVYGLIVLLFVLWWKLAPKYRDVAEKASSKRYVQALVFVPLITLTIDVLSAPTWIYGHWIQRVYGLSVQGWGSWVWDWTKAEVLMLLLTTLVVWILYSVIRKSPRGWWFYFWLASLPIIVALGFLQPLIVDPLFNKFEPLEKKDPALTAELEKMVRRAGETIPPERMFWMGAGEKTTTGNAYVTGIGASERIVVWDTTIARLNTPQVVSIAGHEMGHYVLHHFSKGLGFFAGLLLMTFYIGYRLSGWVLARWGGPWGIRGMDDWASFPVMLLVLAVISQLVEPVGNAFSRYQEQQADQYALEVTHGLIPDSGEVCAEATNILGDMSLADPEPSRLKVLLFYDHPATQDRVKFCLSYDPWGNGGTGEFVK